MAAGAARCGGGVLTKMKRKRGDGSEILTFMGDGQFSFAASVNIHVIAPSALLRELEGA